jgi:3-carboxy-cis,cis-muconate cycloisomerase
MHQALVQEHERASHGWQIEWLTLPQMVALTATALNKALFLSENLVVEAGRMGQNVAASNGLMLAERLNFALAGHMGRVEAKRIIAAACRTALAQNRHLVEVVREITQAPLDWAALKDETAYFGSATTFIDQVLAEAGNVK